MKKKLVILGAGESGVGAAILGKQQNYDVLVSDYGKISDKYKAQLADLNIDFEENKHSEDKILKADLIIKSPGIPNKALMVKKAREKQIPIISEIEFAGRYTSAKKICITGSNGKTTTTLLTYHILKNAGLNVGVAGNVGSSFAKQVAQNDYDFYVIELSSFQLEDMFHFKADIAILMNITPDHLDRYEYQMSRYVDAKFRILQNQKEDDFFIYCADDEIVKNEIEKREIKAQKMPFGLIQPPQNGAGIGEKDNLIINHNKNQFSMSILDLSLQGQHNTYNSMAAGIASKVLNIRNEDIRKSLSNFKGVEHRLEHLIKIHGIEFINDSKATNVNSTWYALESVNTPIVWIAGGQDKGND
ncbi:MAG: UDP-N-acetylmuramoyl-L-alanine--D-glutamate ligase, partial [Draconibacterium sp.]